MTNNKDEPFDDAQGQVERATQTLSEREAAKSREADLETRTPPRPDAEGEDLPRDREQDERASEEDRRMHDDRNLGHGG